MLTAHLHNVLGLREREMLLVLLLRYEGNFIVK